MLPNSKSPHTGKEPVTGSFRPPPPDVKLGQHLLS
jgi:hypothetical protein